MYYTGKIRDTETERGIPSATVRYMRGNNTVGVTVANGQGIFSLNTTDPADKVIISSVGYLLQTFPVYGNFQQNFDLERKPITLEEVILPVKKKNKFPYWLLLLLPLLIKDKK
jgi:hypothetical protein